MIVSPRIAIVLGARVFPGGVLSQMLEDRLAAARDLYREGRIERILFSGAGLRPDYDEVTPSVRWLEAAGIPSEDLLADPAGVRTLVTMLRARRLFAIDAALICTQRFHLPRALFLARRVGIEAIGVPADRRRYRAMPRHLVREGFAWGRALVDVIRLADRP